MAHTLLRAKRYGARRGTRCLRLPAAYRACLLPLFILYFTLCKGDRIFLISRVNV